MLVYLYKKIKGRKTHRTIMLDGMEFGISNFKCQLKYSVDIQEIAYKLWIELISRKIAIPLAKKGVCHCEQKFTVTGTWIEVN